MKNVYLAACCVIMFCVAFCVAAIPLVGARPPRAIPVQAQPVEADPPMRKNLDPKSFPGALQKALKAQKRLSLGERRVLRIINSPDSERRTRQLARMERHVRAELAEDDPVRFGNAAAIDWSTIDWFALFERIIQLILKLLPLFVQAPLTDLSC